jgi:hypothetical protein
MKRVFTAIGWTVLLQLLWGVTQVAVVLLSIDKRWIGDNFLAANYRRMPGQVGGLTDDIIATMLNVAMVAFLVGITASLLWVIIGACYRIYGPGAAARLRWLWVVILIVGALSCAGATYFLIDDTRLVPLDRTVILSAIAAVDFLLSYYVVGTFWPTPRKIRPAVPLARLLPTG